MVNCLMLETVLYRGAGLFAVREESGLGAWLESQPVEAVLTHW